MTTTNTHDRRCEHRDWHVLGVGLLDGAPPCRCHQRRAIRDLSIEVGNMATISNEAISMAALDALDLMALAISDQLRSLRVDLASHDRELIPTSLTITATNDAHLEGVAITIEALTLPTGTPHGVTALEVAADWRARKYALRS